MGPLKTAPPNMALDIDCTLDTIWLFELHPGIRPLFSWMSIVKSSGGSTYDDVLGLGDGARVIDLGEPSLGGGDAGEEDLAAESELVAGFMNSWIFFENFCLSAVDGSLQ